VFAQQFPGFVAGHRRTSPVLEVSDARLGDA
jgi:hypothetical protein